VVGSGRDDLVLRFNWFSAFRSRCHDLFINTFIYVDRPSIRNMSHTQTLRYSLVMRYDCRPSVAACLKSRVTFLALRDVYVPTKGSTLSTRQSIV